MNHKEEVLVLGGGCFWCTEAVFSAVRGVTAVRPGYAGGTTLNPTYEKVCTGKTGYAEVVEVTYDPEQLPLSQLLEIFFAAHDATQLNRQGADVGTQYRSVILYTAPEQREVIEATIAAEAATHDQPVVTEVAMLTAFYPAEISHQRYFELHPQAAYCQAVIGPKLAAVRRKYPNVWKTVSSD